MLFIRTGSIQSRGSEPFRSFPLTAVVFGVALTLAGFLLGRRWPALKCPLYLNIVSFGKRRNHGSAACDLADAVQNDFSATIIELNGSVNFEVAPG